MFLKIVGRDNLLPEMERNIHYSQEYDHKIKSCRHFLLGLEFYQQKRRF